MAEEKTFVAGLRVSKPSEKAPDFIKLNFGAKVDELVGFLQSHKKADGWVNFDLKKSKGGKLYLELNTYEKNGTQTYEQQPVPHTPDPNEQAQLAREEY